MNSASPTAAFAALYDEHSSAAMGLARRMLTNREAAEEVVQDAFLVMWRGGYDATRGSIRAYLLTIVRNRAVDRLRHQRSRPTVVDDSAAQRVPSPERTDLRAEERELARTVATALADLPPDQRSALELAYFAGLTQTEIAAHLGTPLGTVKSRMRMGLQRLRTSIDPVVSP